MPNLIWSSLNSLQVGKYAEYLAKMEFTSYGFHVYSSEVDDHGIDFIVKSHKKIYYEVQVKSLRIGSSNYIFAHKDKFDINQENLFMCVVLFTDGEQPKMYLIPATAWKEENDLLKGKDYENLKSKPEWGINISKKNMALLELFNFSNIISKM
jgi:hypothetical protein